LAFRFNQFTLERERYRLSRTGEPIPVEPQAFNLLVYLIQNRERVVTRDELLEKLWNGKVVTDSALGASIKDARKAVGDSGARQQVIKTIHGRGYQFIANVTETTIDKSPDKEDHSIVREALALPDKPSIAVLPFTNISGDPEQEYFVDGMTDEIITGLSKVPGLFVVANNSTMVYKGRAVDVRRVGSEQGVRYVLEGGIRKVGNQIRVSAQLIDAFTGLHLWAEKYQKELDDIFTVQDEISHNVIVELQIKLVTGERSRPWATGTTNLRAWELITRAKPLIEKHARNDAMLGKQLAREALELDHKYSAAWTMLGWAYWEESVWEWVSEPKKSLQKADEAARKALEEPNFPGSYALLGHIHLARDEVEQAVAMCEKAVEIGPSDANVLALLGNMLISLGRVKEGIQKLQGAIRLCPFPTTWYLSVLGSGYHLIGDNEKAISILERAAEREPESILSHIWLASALVEAGRLDEAQPISKAILDLEPTFSVGRWIKSFKAPPHKKLLDNLLSAGLPK
jgi:TolB-like protein/cytochrome c-type biogenesis protein CcmH/NrfG